MKKIVITGIFVILFIGIVAFLRAPECNPAKCGQSCICKGLKIGNKCIGPMIVTMIDCFNPDWLRR